MKTATIKLKVLFISLSLVLASPAWAQIQSSFYPSQPSPSSYQAGFVPDQLLIKFYSTGPHVFKEDAEFLFKNGTPWSTALDDASTELDKLNQAANLIGVESIFIKRNGMNTEETLRQESEEMAKVLAKFSKRSSRISKDAQRPSLT